MPAEAIDPEYSKMLYKVYNKGVHVLAYQAEVQPEAITLVKKLSVFRKTTEKSHILQAIP